MVVVVSVLMVVALGIRTFAIISLVNSVRSIREIAIMDAVNNRQSVIHCRPGSEDFPGLDTMIAKWSETWLKRLPD